MKIPRKNSKQIFIILAIIMCVSADISSAGEKVIVKGISFFERGRELIAREKALDEAKRAAIEKVLGVGVDSITVVENYAVVSDRILSRSSGYINSFDILQERINDLGTYEITIEAEVETPDLINDIERFQKIFGRQKNPRVSVMIEPGLDKKYMPAAIKTASMVTEKLKESRFKVFRHSEKKAIKMGLYVGLSLELSTKSSTFQGVELTVNEISLIANIYRAGDNEILATASTVEKHPGENRLQALDNGARLCVDSTWKELRSQLIKVWESELYGSRDIFFIVKGISSIIKAQKIASIFQTDVHGVEKTKISSFQKNLTEFHIKYRGWPEYFLNEIEMSYFRKKYFSTIVESITGNRIIVKLMDN